MVHRSQDTCKYDLKMKMTETLLAVGKWNKDELLHSIKAQLGLAYILSWSTSIFMPWTLDLTWHDIDLGHEHRIQLVLNHCAITPLMFCISWQQKLAENRLSYNEYVSIRSRSGLLSFIFFFKKMWRILVLGSNKFFLSWLIADSCAHNSNEQYIRPSLGHLFVCLVLLLFTCTLPATLHPM